MLIVCIMAHAGPGADDDTNYIAVEESIKYPALGAAIQKAEVALVRLIVYTGISLRSTEY